MLFFDERQMVAEVPDRLGEDLIESDEALFTVEAGAGEVFRRDGAEDGRDLPARDVDHVEFDFGIALSVGEGGGKELWVGEGERGLVFGKDAFDAVGEDGLGVGEVAEDFECAPLAGDGSRGEMGGSHAVDGAAEFSRTGEVIVAECFEHRQGWGLEENHLDCRDEGEVLRGSTAGRFHARAASTTGVVVTPQAM